MSEIDIQKYFHFMRDDYGTVYGIQEIGDVRELIKDIRQQNEQLKRLQAENEELKKQIEKQKNAKVQLKNLDSRFADDYCKVKAENEELKKENNLYKSSIVANHDRSIGKRFAELLEENEELKQALEEIRNHCDNYARTEDYVIDQTFNEFLELIYNKSNEVLK